MKLPPFARFLAAICVIVVLAGIGTAAPWHRASDSASGDADQHTASQLLHRGVSLGRLARSLGDPDAITFPSREGSPLSLASWQQQERAFPSRDIPSGGYSNGIRAAQAMEPARGVSWQELGPVYAPNANSNNPNSGAATPVSGRVTALAVVPSTCGQAECQTMYVGAAYGGVWKTTDAGRTWTPILDNQASTAIGAITLDPKNPDIVYVATGEATQAGDSHRGIGILRSTDAGQTWTNLGYNDFVNRAIGQLIVDPRTAGTTHATLYAVSTRAVSGGATTGGGAARTNPILPPIGFYISKDGGTSWTLSNPDGASEGAQSLVMDSHNPDVLYAGFEADARLHADKPNDTSWYLTKGIYRSTDDGATWNHLTSGLPSTYFDSISLAGAASAPSTLYALYSMTPPSKFDSAPFGADGHGELYKSTDAGATWSRLANAPDVCGGQCSYDSPLAVDPTNANVVFAGGTANYGYWQGQSPECARLSPLPATCQATVIKSDNGGQTWSDVSENGKSGPLHPDDHIIVISPAAPDVIYTGNDGGVFHSANGARSWNDLNKGLATLQFTGLSVSPNGDIYGGTQDNGTFKYSGTTTWQHIMSGDGGPTAADPKSSNVIYHSLYGPFLFRNDGAGDPNKDVFIASFAGDLLVRGLGQFYEPYTVAPSKPNVLFYGTYRLWRSKVRGGVDGNGDGDATNDPSDKDDWVPISFDLRCAAQPRIPTATCENGNIPAGRGIASIAVSAKNPNVVAVGTSNGLVWLTTNALAAVKTDSDCRPWTNVRGVALCDYLSGPKWHQIDLGLPQRYPTSIKFAPGSSTTLYVTLSGFNASTPHQSGHVFVSRDAGRHWLNLTGKRKGSSLPDLPFNDIVINPNNSHLYAAADYGGVFVSKDRGSSWQRADAGLPSAPVYQMQYFGPKRTLIVATHGRGVWQTVAP